MTEVTILVVQWCLRWTNSCRTVAAVIYFTRSIIRPFRGTIALKSIMGSKWVRYALLTNAQLDGRYLYCGLWELSGPQWGVRPFGVHLKLYICVRIRVSLSLCACVCVSVCVCQNRVSSPFLAVLSSLHSPRRIHTHARRKRLSSFCGPNV